MHKFIAMVGTNSDESTNRKLLQYMQSHYADQAEIELMEIKGLPIFNKPENHEIPAQTQAMADKIEQADGVIISTPEYDHSAPAALLNALEWLSFHIQPFVDKPVMIIGASYGALGTSRAQAHLRQVLDSPELRARIMPSSEFMLGHSLQAFDDQGNLTDQQKATKLDGLFKDFQVFVEITKKLKNANATTYEEVREMDWEKL
ncbi:putative oxidoreductase (putative) [Lactiplantibacillus plantarum]|uniref:NADPH-dependent FMN reductase n=1 Tax=Lactiplantibacillus plantarum TaxID=1590 RepID=UPI001303CF0D|nr:NADPH-dependent FMN reductase [Lactiplantibacillus plantarum]MCG0595690.1 putative oxidoreductase (putative) [Lactiplantibacillus plantarum]MCG0624382.1 putative oxidoreductase (putative) [Lactiplantibacillus plantarum]MCG0751475.1 putative oxidoreductase (putative) [Lactiplantibacillus plantarum]MCG0760564.1 putative oxidoreductase (putative) [Lactiplantibacillus plantarum]MCG0887686.1 putative oxidoreductase (putative) [Lactiplantibacillus plantarum]